MFISFSFIDTIVAFVFSFFPPSDWISYIPLVNNWPSTAPRGLRHAIWTMSICGELFRGTMKSVCTSRNRQGDEGMKEWKNKRLILNKTEFKISVHEYISMRWYCITSSVRFKEKWLPMRGSAQGVAAQQETRLIICVWTDKQRFSHTNAKLFVH